jgi:hypothetical protein
MNDKRSSTAVISPRKVKKADLIPMPTYSFGKTNFLLPVGAFHGNDFQYSLVNLSGALPCLKAHGAMGWPQARLASSR